MAEQRLDPPLQRLVPLAGLLQEGPAPAFLALKSGVVQILDLFPAVGVHADLLTELRMEAGLGELPVAHDRLRGHL